MSGVGFVMSVMLWDHQEVLKSPRVSLHWQNYPHPVCLVYYISYLLQWFLFWHPSSCFSFWQPSGMAQTQQWPDIPDLCHTHSTSWGCVNQHIYLGFFVQNCSVFVPKILQHWCAKYWICCTITVVWSPCVTRDELVNKSSKKDSAAM